MVRRHIRRYYYCRLRGKCLPAGDRPGETLPKPPRYLLRLSQTQANDTILRPQPPTPNRISVPQYLPQTLAVEDAFIRAVGEAATPLLLNVGQQVKLNSYASAYATFRH